MVPIWSETTHANVEEADVGLSRSRESHRLANRGDVLLSETNERR